MSIKMQVLFDAQQLLQRHYCRNSQIPKVQGTIQGKVFGGHLLVNELWQGIRNCGSNVRCSNILFIAYQFICLGEGGCLFPQVIILSLKWATVH